MATITAKEMAARLNGREYRDEMTSTDVKDAKRSGLVVVFGASDDLMEFRGAINDEVGAYDGTTAHVSSEGLLVSKCSHGADCPYYKMSLAAARKIEAVWCPKEPECSWAFKTDIPHETFDVMEDGELYCRGIVFALADINKTAT